MPTTPTAPCCRQSPSYCRHVTGSRRTQRPSLRTYAAAGDFVPISPASVSAAPRTRSSSLTLRRSHDVCGVPGCVRSARRGRAAAGTCPRGVCVPEPWGCRRPRAQPTRRSHVCGGGGEVADTQPASYVVLVEPRSAGEFSRAPLATSPTTDPQALRVWSAESQRLRAAIAANNGLLPHPLGRDNTTADADASLSADRWRNS